MKNDKIKHQYVVGFKGDLQCVYGNDYKGQVRYANPMTLRQAERAAQKSLRDGTRRIYRLVPITEIKNATKEKKR